MRVDGRHLRTIRPLAVLEGIEVIDQTSLPAELRMRRWRKLADVAQGIETMVVRGAPLIGVAAAYGFALGLRDDASDVGLAAHAEALRRTRPTAVNLAWALERVRQTVAPLPAPERAAAAWAKASEMAEADVAACRRIGEFGLELLRAVPRRSKGPLQVLTHCNAGWLATVDYGTALAPVFLAHDAGVPVHVWVDETRPRNQGLLTAWELRSHGVPHTVIADNAGGLLMQRGQVDVCLVGTDRTTANGDVCNKVGTYLKALAAKDAELPFYVAAPTSSIDLAMASGDLVPIEERSGDEVRELFGTARLPVESPVKNPAFDVTPARLVTRLITEQGTCAASREGLAALLGGAR